MLFQQLLRGSAALDVFCGPSDFVNASIGINPDEAPVSANVKTISGAESESAPDVVKDFPVIILRS